MTRFAFGLPLGVLWAALAISTLAVSPLPAQSCGQEVQASGSLPTDGTLFGNRIAISGDVAVVSAMCESLPSGEECGGGVYVYRRAGSSWVEEQRLAPASLAAGDIFGAAVAVDGDVIAVGSRIDDGSGAVTFFRFDGATWIEEQRIASPTGQADGRFGLALAVSGDRVLVGAERMIQPTASFGGAAYLYQYVAGVWTLETEILNPNPTPGGLYGATVALDEGAGLLVVGRPGGHLINGEVLCFELGRQRLGILADIARGPGVLRRFLRLPR